MINLESLFKLSYSMCIVSSKKNGRYNGCILNTVFQLTPEPPMVAISLNNQSLTNEYINDSGVFAVSILSEDTPMPLIGRFGFRSGREIDKFEKLAYKTGVTGAPVITDHTVAFLEAAVTNSINVESHTLFIAKIAACETLRDSEPMTYNYYRDIKHGKTPKTAATYINPDLAFKNR